MISPPATEASRAAGVGIGSIGFLAGVIASALLLTTVPYILCYRSAPAHQRFTGVLFVRIDTDSYYAWMNQARHGHWLFENKYQPQPHAGAYFNAFWLVLGRLARGLQIPLDAALHIGRLVAGALLVLSFYGLSGFWLRPSLRRLALLLFIFGGGMGWAFALVQRGLGLPNLLHMNLETPQEIALFNGSMDLWAGFHPFFQIFLAPHFAMAHALFLLALYFFLRSEQERSLRDALGAGAILMGLGLSRPYDAVTAMATCALYTGVEGLRRPPFRAADLGRLAAVCGPPTAALAYYVWLFRFHAYFKFWGKGARSLEPSGYVLLALGVCGMAGLYQALRWLGRREEGTARPTFLLCWLVTAGALFGSYPVLKFSGQFGLVLMGPLVLLTALGVQRYFDKRPGAPYTPTARPAPGSPRGFYAGAAALVVINSLSTPVLLYQRTASPQEYYLDERLIAAMQWLEQNTQPTEVVLASEEIGSKIPVYGQNYVFLGHPHLSDDYELRSQQLARFFDAGEDDNFRRALLRENSIAYVFYSPFEKGLGAFAPSSQSYLRKIYGNDTVEIYRVQRDLL